MTAAEGRLCPPLPGREKHASISHRHQTAGAGLPAPDLAGPPGQLPDVGGRLVARKAVEAPGRVIEPHDGIGGPDRKSTRLNSSHTVISTLSLHDALPI